REEPQTRRRSIPELKAGGADEPAAVVTADRRAGDSQLVPVGTDRDADEIREVAGRAGGLPDDLRPALGRDHGRIDVVDWLVGPSLEGAVQRRDREQSRVVRSEGAVVGEAEPLTSAPGGLT